MPDNSGSKQTPKALNQRPTLGFLLASLHTGASRVLWPGIIAAAERRNANLICFPGGRLGATDAFETQRNGVYDLVSAACLDGVITWSSSLGGVLGPEATAAFHQRYRQLPIVSLAQFMEATPTVSVDSYHGMQMLMRHLIETHGYRRLALIRGPEGHYYAQERYRAYLDTLQAYQIEFDPQLVTRPLRWEAGAEAVQILLDERGLRPGIDFQAIVAVSDMLALWALKTLQARGYRVPGDVAISGFNNSIEERLATPPLTTVDMPFFDQGARAVDVLMAHLEGQNVPALTTLPSTVIVRQSCGCPSPALAPVLPVGRPEGLASQAGRSACLAEMAAAAGIEAEKISAWVEPVVAALQEESRHNTAPAGYFLTVLENVLNRAIAEQREIAVWQSAISVLRRWALAGAPLETAARLEALLSQARLAVNEAAQQSWAYWKWQADRQAEKISETSRALLTSFDIRQLINVLAEQLPRLGIPSAYLALYDPQPADARLVLAYTEQGRAVLENGGRRFKRNEIVPPDLLPRHRRYSLVVEPLYFQEKSIGFAVFEIGPRDGSVYELLRSNLSSAVQGALLFEEIQQARLTAEKADRIKTRLLANVSHEMRTPLNIILGYTQNALRQPAPDIPATLRSDLQHIQANAEHQLRVINDLLDLSRAEIDELDLCLELLDPAPLLAEAFQGLADQAGPEELSWQLQLPERLPLIRADALRLRQVFLNLLSNARKFTTRGQVVLGAEVAPPHLHLWVSDTGVGIPPEQLEHIFEPFVVGDHHQNVASGIGLGLSITRHLVMLHGGSLRLESQPGLGSTFHIYLPLPGAETLPAGETTTGQQPAVFVISNGERPPEEIVTIGQRQGVALRLLHGDEALETLLSEATPVALAWDLNSARAADWALIRRLRRFPRLCQTPLILYGQSSPEAGAALSSGLTGLVEKNAGRQNLLEMLAALCPLAEDGPVLIVDDDPQALETHRQLVANHLPGYAIRTAPNGLEALADMAVERPALVLLDMVMPEMDGAGVLEQMRATERLRLVPVIILSNQPLTMEDVQRFEHHARVTFQSKGLWSEDEAAAALHRALFGSDGLPAHTAALVKRAVAYLHQNYTRPLARWEIANAVGVSEDYLTRVFNRELGLSPWDYLNRYRVLQARLLLRQSSESIGAIAYQVGFKEQSYFSRVFHKLTGMSPQAYRAASEEGGNAGFHG